MINLPVRPLKPRNVGITMVIDKGLSLAESESLVEKAGDYIDMVKIGFGSSLITKNLAEKIKIFKEKKINVFFGGTLFELFFLKKKINDFIKFNKKHELNIIEISDGSIKIDHQEKCKIINQLSREFKVISEVGSKLDSYALSNKDWVEQMTSEISSGSWKVIAESRESGNKGMYDSNFQIDEKLFNLIVSKIDTNKIIWETPLKAQQSWFIRKLGTDVNLGNISTDEVIALECLRLGLRADTLDIFHQ